MGGPAGDWLGIPLHCRLHRPALRQNGVGPLTGLLIPGSLTAGLVHRKLLLFTPYPMLEGSSRSVPGRIGEFAR